MTTHNIYIEHPTIASIFGAISVLADVSGLDDDSTVTIDSLDNGAVIFTASPPPPHKGKKQRCRATDAHGRRCVRGPRHPESHRYENGADYE